MALKAADIAKRLPQEGKKNCRECGLPTCFAFAMKLASGGVAVEKCPYISDELKAELTEGLAAAIRLVTIGVGERAISIGEEEVVYRHEKTFLRQPAIGILISDSEDDQTITQKIDKVKGMEFERVNQILRANLIAVRFAKDPQRYLDIVKMAASTQIPVVLVSEDSEVLFSAADSILDRRPLLYPINKDNIEATISRLKEKPTPIGVKAEGIEELIPLTSRLKEAGINEIVLDPSPKGLKDMIRDYTLIRRAGLKHSFRPLGYPIISFPCFMAQDLAEQVMIASSGVIKYAGIIILSDFDKNTILPLLVLSQNIYTDPRKPLVVESKIYEIGEMKSSSPVLITTNFALTYFAVSSEVEKSKIPSYLCIQDTGGLCVAASWATGKFNGETISQFIKTSKVEERVDHRRLIVPGLLGKIRGEIEESLPDWEIVVGPLEAKDIPTFLPTIAKN